MKNIFSLHFADTMRLMEIKMKQQLIRTVNQKKVFVFRIIAFTICFAALFCMDFFKIGDAGFKVFSGGAGTPDMQFGYKPEWLFNVMETLGTEGRLFYLRFLLFDFIFIISFAFTQAEILKIIMGKILLAGKWRYVISLSYLRGVFDAVENILLLVILNNYPAHLNGIATVAGISTKLKFISLALWIVFAIVVFIVRKLGNTSK